MARETEATASGIAADPGYRVIYPWHADIWARQTRDVARLSHALLLRGPAGLGKHAFAWRLAHSLLCSTPETEFSACTRCRSCVLFAAGTHPDLAVVAPIDDHKTIGVDQVRALGEFLALRPHTSTHKVVLLAPADAMNIHAANSLLKLLEEPPPGVVFLLVTAYPSRLPATVRSRCADVSFRVPERSEAMHWLAQQPDIGPHAEQLLTLAGGAPLRALQLGDGFLETDRQLRADIETMRSGRVDPVSSAARWQALGTGLCLDWLQMYVSGTLHTHGQEYKLNKSNINELMSLYNVISQAKTRVGTGADETLLLEEILVRMARTADVSS